MTQASEERAAVRVEHLWKSFSGSVLAEVERLCGGGRRRGNDSSSRGDRDDEREAA